MGLSEWVEAAVDSMIGRVEGVREVREEAELETDEGMMYSKAIVKVYQHLVDLGERDKGEKAEEWEVL